jgi:hypothetical protein
MSMGVSGLHTASPFGDWQEDNRNQQLFKKRSAVSYKYALDSEINNPTSYIGA